MIDYAAYARLVLKKGLALKKGQRLLINCNAGNYNMAQALGEQAYAMGAGYVEISVHDDSLTNARLANQDTGALKYIPHYQINQAQQMLSEDWARILIENTEELDILKDADPEKMATLTKNTRETFHFVLRSLMKGEHPWCVICSPGPQWAKKVLGKEASEEDLWDVLKPILRLDAEDPETAWDEHGAALTNRSRHLDEMKLDRLHFLAEGTDLTMGLNRISRWQGGPHTALDGSKTFNNIPTEEIFTTPDFTRCEGKVQVTKELKVLETMVRGASFRFEKGQVVDFDAEKGKEVLGKFLRIDEGSRSLGELALVDESSPIAASGLNYGSILLDENASCHIALGAGYPGCLNLPSGVSGEGELKAHGCNVSIMHTDFMVGSPTLDITGYDRDGNAHPIIRKGSFVI